MKKLTERQLEAVKYISDCQKIGINPSLSQIAENLGVTARQTVKDLLDSVARKGYLERKPDRARAIMLKPEARREIEKICKRQIGFDLKFSSEKSNCFPWDMPQGNIIINQGELSASTKILTDSSSIIPHLKKKDLIGESFEKIQFVAEKSNFEKLNSSSQKNFVENYDYLIVAPVTPFLGEIDGYVLLNNNSLYEMVWSGSSSKHYFRFGKEYGSTDKTTYIDTNTNQISLFPLPLDASYKTEVRKKMRSELKSYSQYVDYPIYGGALKKNGEVLYWSRGIDKDINDLRSFFLIDITKTNFQSNDKALLRDISQNFPNLINNST